MKIIGLDIYQEGRAAMMGKSQNGVFLLCCVNWSFFWKRGNKIEDSVFGGMFGENGLIGLERGAGGSFKGKIIIF